MTWYRQVLYYFCFRNERDHGKTSKLLGLLSLELQDYIQTLAFYQHVKHRMHMGWEVINDSFKPCMFCEKLLDSQCMGLSGKVNFLLPRKTGNLLITNASNLT